MKTANSLKLAVFFCLVVEPQEYARHLRLAIAEQVNTKAFDWRNTNQIRLVKYILCKHTHFQRVVRIAPANLTIHQGQVTF